MAFEIKRARGKTAVFAGAKQPCDSPRSVRTLQQLCIQKLLDNANKIECVGDVPYYILRPLMEQVSLDQLKLIESWNPHLAEDPLSHLPWEKFCRRHFERKLRRDSENWAEYYKRQFKLPFLLKEYPPESKKAEDQTKAFEKHMREDFYTKRKQRYDELWEEFCKLQSGARRRDDVTWLEYFDRRSDVKDWRDIFRSCERDNDHKIEKIAKRIKRHEEKAVPQRQVRVVENQLSNGKRAIQTVIRKTIRNHVPVRGHSLNGSSTPSSSSSSSSSRPGTAIKTTTVVIRREAGNGSGTKLLKPKTAPLMQKSMQLFKSRFRR